MYDLIRIRGHLYLVLEGDAPWAQLVCTVTADEAAQLGLELELVAA